MKICILLAAYKPIPPVKGGAVETIVQNFVNLNEKYNDFDFTILSPYDINAEKKSKTFKNTRVVFFKGNEKLDTLYYWCIYKVLKKFLNIILPDYIIRNRMVNYIVKHQNEFDWILVEAGELDCFRFYSKKLDVKKIIYHSHGEIQNKKKLDNCLQYYIAVSNYIKKVWEDTVNWNNNRTITLLNGINQERFKIELSINEKSEFRKKFDFFDTDIVLLFVGRIIEEKGVKELLEALVTLPNNFKLLMVGSASFGTETSTKYEKEVKKLISNLNKRVAFTGFIPNNEIGIYYKLADISVVPSVFNDPAPLVIIEAMSAGLPIITTGTGGISEYCNKDCAIFLDKDKDMVRELAFQIRILGMNKELCKKMGKASKSRAKEFTDYRQYKSLVNLLNKIER